MSSNTPALMYVVRANRKSNAFFNWLLQCVDGLAAVADGLLPDALDDVVHGMPVGQPLPEHASKFRRLLFFDHEARASRAQQCLVLLLGILRVVEMLLKLAFRLVPATITHVGCLLKAAAGLLHVGWARCGHAELPAIRTAGPVAPGIRALLIVGAASLPVHAIVERTPVASHSFYADVLAHLTGDARTVLARVFRDLLEAVAGLES